MLSDETVEISVVLGMGMVTLFDRGKISWSFWVLVI